MSGYEGYTDEELRTPLVLPSRIPTVADLLEYCTEHRVSPSHAKTLSFLEWYYSHRQNVDDVVRRLLG